LIDVQLNQTTKRGNIMLMNFNGLHTKVSKRGYDRLYRACQVFAQDFQRKNPRVSIAEQVIDDFCESYKQWHRLGYLTIKEYKELIEKDFPIFLQKHEVTTLKSNKE